MTQKIKPGDLVRLRPGALSRLVQGWSNHPDYVAFWPKVHTVVEIDLHDEHTSEFGIAVSLAYSPEMKKKRGGTVWRMYLSDIQKIDPQGYCPNCGKARSEGCSCAD